MLQQKKNKKRDETIRKIYHSKNITYSKIGKRYKISAERVRQIVLGISELKKEEKAKWVEQHKKHIKKVVKTHLFNEIQRLSVQNRSKELTEQRKILVKILRDKYGFSFNQIGFLLQRDRSSIINLYYS